MTDLNNISSRESIIDNFKPSGVGIEVGVQEGVFANYILKKCPNLKLYLLDCWQMQDQNVYFDISNVDNNDQAQCLLKTIINNADYFDRVRIIKEFSDQAVEFFNNNFFDFIYIDANHSYESVKNDLIKWFPKLKSGGLFAGHDYVNGWHGQNLFGVQQAVDEFASEYNLKLYSTKENWKNWFIIK